MAKIKKVGLEKRQS